MTDIHFDFTDSFNDAINGSESAFDFLYSKSVGALREECLKHLNNPNDVENALQETYVRIYQNLNTLSDPNAFIEWARNIARDTCINMIAKREQEQSLDNFEYGSDSYELIEGTADVPTEEIHREIFPGNALDSKEKTTVKREREEITKDPFTNTLKVAGKAKRGLLPSIAMKAAAIVAGAVIVAGAGGIVYSIMNRTSDTCDLQADGSVSEIERDLSEDISDSESVRQPVNFSETSDKESVSLSEDREVEKEAEETMPIVDQEINQESDSAQYSTGDIEILYSEQLDNYYAVAVNGTPGDHDVNWNPFSTWADSEEIQYAFADLAGDGVPELLLSVPIDGSSEDYELVDAFSWNGESVGRFLNLINSHNTWNIIPDGRICENVHLGMERDVVSLRRLLPDSFETEFLESVSKNFEEYLSTCDGKETEITEEEYYAFADQYLNGSMLRVEWRSIFDIGEGRRDELTQTELAADIHDFVDYISTPQTPAGAGSEFVENDPEHFDIVYRDLRLDTHSISEKKVLEYGLLPDTGGPENKSDRSFYYKEYSDYSGGLCLIYINSVNPEPYLCGVKISILDEGEKAFLENDRGFSLTVGDSVYDYINQYDIVPEINTVGGLIYYRWTDQESCVFRITTDSDGIILELSYMYIYV